MQRTFDDLQLGSIELFCLAAAAGSFTAAAATLGQTKAVISFNIRQLEDSLGVALLLRSTRRSWRSWTAGVGSKRPGLR